MPCYDIIVKLQNLGSAGLSVQYRKRDELEISTKALKWTITYPCTIPELI